MGVRISPPNRALLSPPPCPARVVERMDLNRCEEVDDCWAVGVRPQGRRPARKSD